MFDLINVNIILIIILKIYEKLISLKRDLGRDQVRDVRERG